MKKLLIFASAALLMTQCAAVNYQVPQPGSDDIKAAQATLDGAGNPQKSSKSFDERAALTANAAEILRSIIKPFCDDLKSVDCNFTVKFATDPVINAFVDRRGNVFITLDLLAYLDNEDEIATVLAHEIAHRLNGDDFHKSTTLKISQALKYQRGGSSPTAANSRSSSSAHYLISREIAADYLAAYLLTHAGYDAAKSEATWIKLAAVSDHKAASDFATHPLSAERLATWRMTVKEIGGNPRAMPVLDK